MFNLTSAPAAVKFVAPVFAFMVAVPVAPVISIPAPDMTETDESWLMDDATLAEMQELSECYDGYMGAYA